MEIQLKHGLRAKFDDTMAGVFLPLKWNLLRGRGKPYVRHNLYSQNEKKLFDVFMHHMVVGRPLHGKVVDHINGDTLDNRAENLRIISHRENSVRADKIATGTKTSKYVGVSRSKGKWISVIQINGHLNYLGRFSSEEQARDAYKKAKEAL